MSYYMNADTKNKALVMAAFKVWVEDLVDDKYPPLNHPHWEEIKGLLSESLVPFNKAFKKFFTPVEMKQRRQVERLCKCSRALIVTDTDTRGKEEVVEVPKENWNYICTLAMQAECTLCDRDKNRMQKCHLRFVLKRQAPQDVADTGMYQTGACEFSKMV